jgi:hypothetical protein
MCLTLGKVALVVLASDEQFSSADDLAEQLRQELHLGSLTGLWRIEKVTVFENGSYL